MGSVRQMWWYWQSLSTQAKVAASSEGGNDVKLYQWVLAIIGTGVVLALAALLTYDVCAMLFGWVTLSVLGSELDRVWVFLLGMFWGLLLGVCAGHLWPIEGRKR